MICCKFCAEKNGEVTQANWAAPRYVGGDEDGFVEWIPVCEYHAQDWYDEIEESRKIRMFELLDSDHACHPDHNLVEAIAEEVK